jgi:RIO-like serine/threonine protein kinase
MNKWGKMFWSKDLVPGRKIGGYTLLSELGSGKLGFCWKAQGQDGREVCLKVLWGSTFGDTRLYALREYRALQQFAPLNVAPRPLEAYLTPWVCCIVMQFIEGRELASVRHWKKDEYVAALEAVEPFFSMSLPLWHEDMHLGNFMWDGKKVWLIDLGQARMPSEVGPVAQDNRARRVAQWKAHIEWVKQWK